MEDRESSRLAPEDATFVEDFESLRLPAEAFSHRQHVRLAWALLRLDAAGALDRVERGIRRFATHHGAAPKYHVTMTVAWMRLVGTGMDQNAPAEGQSFEDWIAGAPALLDAGRLKRHYSEARLASDEARQAWVEPDLEPIGAPRR